MTLRDVLRLLDVTNLKWMRVGGKPYELPYEKPYCVTSTPYLRCAGLKPQWPQAEHETPTKHA
eukprot:5888729-Amphidinium_carterae.1